MRNITIVAFIVSLFALVLVPIPTTYAATDNAQVSVKAIPGETLTDVIAKRTKSSWPWFVIRASGLVAGVSLVVLMLSGIGSVTGHTFRWLEPLTAWATHRALGIMLAISIVFHVMTLLFDKFTPFGVIDILVPWASPYKTLTLFGINLGSLFVALGILALYGSLAIVVTSLFWIDTKQKLWKFHHIASYAVMGAVFIHALFLGTDTSDGLGRIAWIVAGIAVFIAVIARLKRTGTT